MFSSSDSNFAVHGLELKGLELGLGLATEGLGLRLGILSPFAGSLSTDQQKLTDRNLRGWIVGVD